MRSYVLHGVMTPKRLAYLKAVADAGTYEPRHSVVANHCIRLGWVESVARLPDGSLSSWADLSWNDKGEFVGQRLTDEGRRMLERESASA